MKVKSIVNQNSDRIDHQGLRYGMYDATIKLKKNNLNYNAGLCMGENVLAKEFF